MPWIKVGDHRWPLESITDSTDGLAPHEKSALDFIQRWQKGTQQFEFFTSGSTGEPKKITFDRSQLEKSARITEQALGLASDQTALVCLDTKFIAGAMMLVRSLVTGMNIIVQKASSNPLAEIIEPVDFMAVVPLQLNTLLKENSAKLNKLKTVIIGGAPLHNNSVEALQSLAPAFYATYGMTETISHVALQKLNGPDQEDAFKLLPGISATTDDRGCLRIQADHLGAFPIVTNDVVEFVDARRFRWIGRWDRVINSGGVKVSAEKIEQVAENVFATLQIHRAFFIGSLPDAALGEKIVLVIEDDALPSTQTTSILQGLRLKLRPYEVPREVLLAPVFKQTTTQKVDRIGTLKSLFT
ncbi:MAG: AMP-binding protein [Cyclobacteriaceae bacterium]|nr:AMP-binding protein [Cyclobacteriaceae bacterium]